MAREGLKFGSLLLGVMIASALCATSARADELSGDRTDSVRVAGIVLKWRRGDARHETPHRVAVKK